jgi:pimeloyl-ACP methyl ester carboxylesterase
MYTKAFSCQLQVLGASSERCCCITGARELRTGLATDYPITKSLNAFYNSCFTEGSITTGLHPVRWVVALAISAPVILGTAFLFARLGGNQDFARSCLRGLRYLLAAEFSGFALLVMVGLAYEHRARAGEAALFHPPGELIDLGGYRLHLYCTGTGGPTVILEHGHRATYLDWYLVQPKVAEFNRVCSFDRGGHGWSDLSPRPRVPSAMAEELHTLLRASGERPPYILVGHSFGGLNAIMFAKRFPDEVAGVVLVDSPHPDVLRRAPWRAQLWLRMMRFTMPFGLPRWRGWCEGGPQETLAIKRALMCMPQSIETILHEDASFPAAAREIRGITSLGSVPLAVIARDPAKGRNAALEARHSQQQRGAMKLSTNSRFIVAEGSAHDVPLARPDVVVEAVRSLLKPQAQAGSRGTP